MTPSATYEQIAVDRDGAVLWASPSTGRVLGYPETWDEPGGVFSLIHPDDVPGAVARFQALIDAIATTSPASCDSS